MTESARILLAEDDDALLQIMRGLLEGAGLKVTAAPDGREALTAFEALVADGTPPDAVLADINMPHVDGMELIDRLKALDPQLPVIFVTAYSSVDSAVAALRKGAFDYVTKPFRNDQLVRIVQNAVRQRQLTEENQALRKSIGRTFGIDEIVERSPGLAGVFGVVEKAAPTGASLLIRGETGTGKELVARGIHHASPRAAQPFLSVNCAALPEGLLESELFGHEKGAFTGATAKSKGLFRGAHRGTLFLDEVGEMSPALQAKLLRVLESREVRPVGATESVRVDVRIVAATHRDLLAEVEAERFREDLFYRLAVIEIEVPPLRERPDDVGRLARYFLGRIARDRSEPERKLTPEALDLLTCYRWPGNVRELLNAMEHAATLGGETLGPDDLPPRLRMAAADEHSPTLGGSDEQFTLADLEQRHVRAVLRKVGGDRKQAAKLLGIDLSTLYRKLKRWE